jgi:hypothetical protein
MSAVACFLGPVCLSFLAASQHEKSEAQTNSELLVQLLESWKPRKAKFIWKSGKLSFTSFP